MEALAVTSTWRVRLLTILGAVAATLVVRTVALLTLTIPPEFQPLATPGPTIFLTVVGTAAGILVFEVIRRRAPDPLRLFRRVALVALVVSFVPDLYMLTDGAAAAFPGATVGAVSTLMVQHVAAWAVVVWMLTMRR